MLDKVYEAEAGMEAPDCSLNPWFAVCVCESRPQVEPRLGSKVRVEGRVTVPNQRLRVEGRVSVPW